MRNRPRNYPGGRLTLAAAAAALLICACSEVADPASNPPVISSESLADPHVIAHDGGYYLYGTAGAADHYDVFYSTDGLQWEKQRSVFSADSDTLWAPDVFHDPASDHFYLYYSNKFSIGVAVADSPAGPFIDQGLLIEDAIDAHMYSEDGRYYLYYATAGEGFRSLEEMGRRMFAGMFQRLLGDDSHMIRKTIYVQEMASPTETTGAPPVALLSATEDWEKGYSLYVVEGPWMLRQDDTYYLMYSGSPTHESDYAVGYATASSPTGPFTKSADNPLLYSTSDAGVFGKTVHGPGHHSVVENAEGGRWIYFHQNARRFNIGMGQRYAARGELLIDGDGKLRIRLGAADIPR